MITMGVQKDAGELLLFFYNELINNGKKSIETKEVLKETKWESTRLNLAHNYLNELGLLKGGGGLPDAALIELGAKFFFVTGLSPRAIDVIENEPKFEKTFGFEVNIGVFKFSWSKTKK
ncbi:MAG: hypothetical protein J5U17_00010 [Candidatus Methanoperedens sp.]|nr:hypothetical protein [Candidatus Methanoperedens sp.]MCE8428298.1 hypothetical protein [Candidatus Methanoperedens sp.]